MKRFLSVVLSVLFAAGVVVWSGGVPLVRAQTSASPETAPLISLADAMKMARQANEDMLINRDMLEQARLVRNRAWAALLPRLTARGSYTYNDKEIERQGTVIQRQDVLAGNLTLTLSLLNPAAIPGVVGAHRSARASDYDAQWNESELLFEVARAYYAALTSEQMVRAATRSLETAREHHEAIRELLAVGRAIALDESRFALQVVEATETLTRARSAHDSSLDYLAYLIVQELPFRTAAPTAPDLPPDAPSGNLREQQRPDIVAARLKVDAAEAMRVQSWLNYLPVLGLAAAGDWTQNTGWSGDPYSWRVMLTLEWVLVDAGLRWATQKERDSQLRVAKTRQRQMARRLAKERRDTLRSHMTALAVFQSAQTRLTLARQTQEMVLTRFRAGMATSLELTDANDGLTRAETTLAASELEVSIATLNVLRAFGYAPPGGENWHE